MAKTRFKVEFTADEQLCADIQRAKELLGFRLPRGELNELFGLALRRLIEELEKKKLAKTSRPRPASAASPQQGANKSRHIPNHIKRRSHNQLAAEHDYGAEFMAAKTGAEGPRGRRPKLSG